MLFEWKLIYFLENMSKQTNVSFILDNRAMSSQKKVIWLW